MNHNLTLAENDPYSLLIACDARLQEIDYTNDQCWQLEFIRGEPPSLCIQTNFGLRARSLRMFPRFFMNSTILSDPSQFSRQVIITKTFPNYIQAKFSPFEKIDVVAEFWVPSSSCIAGRMRVENKSSIKSAIGIEWVVLLSPLEGQGEGMHTESMYAQPHLLGKTSNLFPVCIGNEGCKIHSSPYPALFFEIESGSGKPASISWALSSTNHPDFSFEQANAILRRSWDAEISRIERLNQSESIEINTGNPKWDAVFHFSQVSAYQMLINPEGKDSVPNFISNRFIDTGHSLRGDGSDYPSSWRLQHPFDAYFLMHNLLPGGVTYCQRIIEGFLADSKTQNPSNNNRIDYMKFPLLATMAYQVGKYTHPTWLSSIFPLLYDNFVDWFTQEYDIDLDGFPEWKTPIQTAIPMAPLFDIWHQRSQGIPVSLLESPSMVALLLHECQNLLYIAKIIGKEEKTTDLAHIRDGLNKSLQSIWNEKIKNYQYRDTHNHLSTKGSTLLTFDVNGKFPLKFKSSKPQRFSIAIMTSDDRTRSLQIVIHGQNQNGILEEKLTSTRLFWSNRVGRYTSLEQFSKIDWIEVMGLLPGDKGRLSTPDYTLGDISAFLPLITGYPSKKQASGLIEKNIFARYENSVGLSIFENRGDNDPPVQIPWVALILEGLLRYGYREASVRIFNSIMNTLTQQMEKNHFFSEMYASSDAHPIGAKNHLHGLAPTRLFLDILGVKYIQADYAVLEGENPFPWPVTVKFRGLTISRHAQDTLVVFPDGQRVSLTGPGPFEVRFKPSLKTGGKA